MSTAEIKLRNIIDILDRVVPPSCAEDWDNVGLMSGHPEQVVKGVLVALDPTRDLLKEAAAVNANLIITHHPVIFRPWRHIRLNEPGAAFVAGAIRNNVAVFACHTNLDAVRHGINDALAGALGILDCRPLRAAASEEPVLGLGLSGRLRQPLPGREFLQMLCAVLQQPAVRICGRLPEIIQRAAVCGGSGSDFATAARHSGAQIYISGEIKHSTARWAEEVGFCIVDAGHFGTENTGIPVFADLLRGQLKEQGLELPVIVSSRQCDPMGLFVAQS
ncbi:Nif3-like dinuclear metal center hexameric protein [Desulfobacterota bacterium M19]